MANHVSTYIQLHGLNKDAVKFLEERFAFLKTDKGQEGVHLVFPDFETNPDGSVATSVYYDRVGSKWCYVEDFCVGEDTADIALTSAWCMPNGFVEWLAESVNEISSESKVFVSYEDEMPNFYGCQVYIGGVFEDGMESEDTDEIDTDLCYYDSDFKEALEELQSLDEDDDEYGDLEEKVDELRNTLIWDMIKENQTAVFNEYY